MAQHGITAQTEIDRLLDKLIEVIAERDLALEKLAYAEHLLASCREASGWVEA